MATKKFFIIFMFGLFVELTLTERVCVIKNCKSCSDGRLITWKYWLPYKEFPQRPVKVIFQWLSSYVVNETLPICNLNEILREKIDALHHSKSLIIVLMLSYAERLHFSFPFTGGFDNFAHANDIESLSVFGTHISIDEFCPLKNLKILRLEANKISNFTSVGCGEGQCCHNVQRLILTENDYSITKPETDYLKNLTSLEVRSYINSIEESALSEMSNLKEFSLRFAKLKSILPQQMFPETIKRIYIEYTNINYIPESFFNKLYNLSHLTLSKNKILFTNDSYILFKDLQNLQSLELSRNGIVAIPENFFINFKQLAELDLSGNFLRFFNSTSLDVFNGLENLEYLDLSGNEIDFLYSHLFEKLTTLKTLKLDRNKLTVLEPDMFIHLEQLEALSLRFNKIALPSNSPPIFGRLINLKALDLRRNKISYINENIFKGLEKLEFLDLSFNSIEAMENTSFQSLANLRRLNLNFNKIQAIGNEFYPLLALEELHLIINNIQNISAGILCNSPFLKLVDFRWNGLKTIVHDNQTSHFSCLEQLKVLKLSHNEIKQFDYSMIPSSLIILELSDNIITELTDQYGLRFTSNLTHLDVSKNYIDILTEESFPIRCHIIDLYLNRIYRIEANTFGKLTNLKKISLLRTEIKAIDRFALGTIPAIWSAFKGVTFHITTDDKKQEQFLKSQLKELSSKMLANNTEDFLKCFNVNVKFIEFEVNTYGANLSNELICQRKHYGMQQLCVEYNENQTIIVDPKAINTVYHNSLDCGFQNVSGFPDDFPTNITKLFLDGGDIPTLHSDQFSRLSSLEILFLNNSNIRTIHDNAFRGLTKLHELHLENNNLETINIELFTHLKNLEKLYIDNNLTLYNTSDNIKDVNNFEVIVLGGNTFFDDPHKIYNL